MKGLEKFKQDLDNNVLVHLQNPLALRLVVLGIIGMAGLGGVGSSLYFKLGALYAKNQEQQVRKVLIREHQDIKQTLAAYMLRISPNTEFIEWVRDLREICRQSGLTILSLNPALATTKDPNAIRQLTVELNVSGSYLNILKLLGRFEYDKVRINISELSLNPIIMKKGDTISGYFLHLKVGILMQPLSAKKDAKDKTAHQPVQKTEAAPASVAISTAAQQPGNEKPVKTTPADTPKVSSTTVVSTSAVSTVTQATKEPPKISKQEPMQPKDKTTKTNPAASSKFGPVSPTKAADTKSSSKFSAPPTIQAVSPGTAPATKFSAAAAVEPPKKKIKKTVHQRPPVKNTAPENATTTSGGSSKFSKTKP